MNNTANCSEKFLLHFKNTLSIQDIKYFEETGFNNNASIVINCGNSFNGNVITNIDNISYNFTFFNNVNAVHFYCPLYKVNSNNLESALFIVNELNKDATFERYIINNMNVICCVCIRDLYDENTPFSILMELNQKFTNDGFMSKFYNC